MLFRASPWKARAESLKPAQNVQARSSAILKFHLSKARPWNASV